MSESKRTYVIAEAGSCHEGELWRAIELTRIANQVGADAIKWQFWSDARALAKQRSAKAALASAYESYQLPEAWIAQLSALAG